MRVYALPIEDILTFCIICVPRRKHGRGIGPRMGKTRQTSPCSLGVGLARLAAVRPLRQRHPALSFNGEGLLASSAARPHCYLCLTKAQTQRERVVTPHPPPPSTAMCCRGRVTRPGRAPIAWGDASLPSPRSCMCPRALCARQERVDRALPTFFSRFSAHFPVPPPFFMHTHTFHICSLHLLLMYARYDVSWVHVARARCAGRARATCPRGDARHASRPMRAARGWCPIRASPGAGGWR